MGLGGVAGMGRGNVVGGLTGFVLGGERRSGLEGIGLGGIDLGGISLGGLGVGGLGVPVGVNISQAREERARDGTRDEQGERVVEQED